MSNRSYYTEDDDNETEWESSAWNFNSAFHLARRREEHAKNLRQRYYDRLEQVAKHPPDEDNWN